MRGFSLIELMVVVAILAFIAAMVFPNIIGEGEKAKKKITCVQMANIAKSLELYKLDNSTYPKNIKSLIEKGYIKKEATDPWGKKIIYVKLKDGFELISLGKDGIESSDDIKYSECK